MYELEEYSCRRKLCQTRTSHLAWKHFDIFQKRGGVFEPFWMLAMYLLSLHNGEHCTQLYGNHWTYIFGWPLKLGAGKPVDLR